MAAARKHRLRPRRLRPRRRLWPRRLRPEEGSGPQGSGQEEGRSQEGSGPQEGSPRLRRRRPQPRRLRPARRPPAKKAPARKKAAAKKAPARKKAAKKAPRARRPRPRRLRPARRLRPSALRRARPPRSADRLPCGSWGAACTEGGWPDAFGSPPLGQAAPARAVASEAVRLVTWNVNSLKARLERVEEWLAECQPDVVCMQETKLADTAFPAMAFSALGYESAHHGEGRWNGVAILSRVGLDDVVAGFGDGEPADDEARLLDGDVRRGPRDERVRAQRAGARPRALPVQARAGWTGSSATSTPRPIRPAPVGAVRRLQHRARPIATCGTPPSSSTPPTSASPSGRRSQRSSTGASPTCSGLLPRRRPALLLVGLPGRQLPQGHRDAHRPRARVGAVRRAGRSGHSIDRNARKGKQPSDHAPAGGRPGGRARERRSPLPPAGNTPGSPGWAARHAASSATWSRRRAGPPCSASRTPSVACCTAWCRRARRSR